MYRVPTLLEKSLKFGFLEESWKYHWILSKSKNLTWRPWFCRYHGNIIEFFFIFKNILIMACIILKWKISWVYFIESPDGFTDNIFYCCPVIHVFVFVHVYVILLWLCTLGKKFFLPHVDKVKRGILVWDCPFQGVRNKRKTRIGLQCLCILQFNT